MNAAEQAEVFTGCSDWIAKQQMLCLLIVCVASLDNKEAEIRDDKITLEIVGVLVFIQLTSFLLRLFFMIPVV